MNKDGFMLTIGGCPVIFTSPGINIQNTYELPLTHADFAGFASEVSLSSIAHGAFSPKFGSWTEKVDLATGLLDVTSLSFRIEDILMDYLGTEKNIASYLFTRDDQESYSADLFNCTEGSDEGSVRLLFNFSAVTSTNYFWSQGECFKVEDWPSSGKNLTFYKRGVFNTFKRNKHNEFFDINQNQYADLFFEYPGISGQEVLLWRKYTKNNETIWHVIWRGVANRAPRSTGDGAAIEIQADSFPNHFNRSKFFHKQTVCKIVGYDSRRIAFNVQETNSADTPSGLDNSGWLYTTNNLFTSDQHFKLTDEVVYLANNGLLKNQKAPLIRVIMDNIDFGEQLYDHFAFTNADDGTRASNTIGFSHYLANPTMTTRACYGRTLVLDGQQQNGGTEDSSFQPGARPNRRYRSYVDSPGDGAFNVFKHLTESDFVVTDPRLTNNRIPVQYQIQTSSSFNPQVDGSVRHAYICEFEPSFINEENIKINSRYEPLEINWQTPWTKELLLFDGVFSKSFMNVRPDGQLIPYSTLGSLTGSTIVVRDLDEVHPEHESNKIHVFTEEKELKSYSLIRGMGGTTVGYGLLKNQFNQNYYLSDDSAEFDAIFSGDFGERFVMECRLDGSQSNSEICTNMFAIENLVQGLTETDSKFTFRKLNKQRTININQSILIGKPTWEYSTDYYYSTYKFNSRHFPGKELTVNNQDAIAKYGTGKTLDIDLDVAGMEYRYFATSQIDNTYQKLISIVLNKPRYNTAPAYKVKFKIPIDYDFGSYAGYSINGNAINVITIGKTLYLTDWILPNGLGGRGMQSAEIVVISKTVNFQDGTIEIEGIKQPRNSSAIGISPCVKVSSIDPSLYLINVSTTNYLNLSGSSVGAQIPENYAGSNLNSYGGLSDGGAKYFSAGQKVQLILRNSTTYSTLDLTVNTTTGGLITVSETITTSPVDWPAQAALGNVDLRFADYETAIDSQLTWAYIGDGDDGLINNSSQAQRIF